MDEMMGDLDSSSSSEDEEEILTPSQEEAQREMEIERKKLKEEKIKQDELKKLAKESEGRFRELAGRDLKTVDNSDFRSGAYSEAVNQRRYMRLRGKKDGESNGKEKANGTHPKTSTSTPLKATVSDEQEESIQTSSENLTPTQKRRLRSKAKKAKEEELKKSKPDIFEFDFSSKGGNKSGRSKGGVGADDSGTSLKSGKTEKVNGKGRGKGYQNGIKTENERRANGNKDSSRLEPESPSKIQLDKSNDQSELSSTPLTPSQKRRIARKKAKAAINVSEDFDPLEIVDWEEGFSTKNKDSPEMNSWPKTFGEAQAERRRREKEGDRDQKAKIRELNQEELKKWVSWEGQVRKKDYKTEEFEKKKDKEEFKANGGQKEKSGWGFGW